MLPTTMTTATAAAMGLNTGMGQGMTLDSAITATAVTSTATMTAAQANLPHSTAAAKGNPQHQQQLLQSGAKMPSQLNEAAAGSNSATEEQQQQQQPPSMSYILRSQLDELKRLPEPLGSNLLTHNELDVCKKHNITPTTYLSLKTVCLSGAPPLGSPMEISLRKFFIKCGWLSH